MPDSSDDRDQQTGVWLAWPVVEAVLRLKLRQASRWRVFLAVLLVSARYGGRDARLGIEDLSRMTGLAPRTVKGALSALRKGGLVVRVRRVRLLSVPLLTTRIAPLNGPVAFTSRQKSVIASVLAEVSKLLGGDAASLNIPADYAGRLGLQSPISYGQAYDQLRRSASRKHAAIFVGAVLALRHDQRVQGRDLE